MAQCCWRQDIDALDTVDDDHKSEVLKAQEQMAGNYRCCDMDAVLVPMDQKTHRSSRDGITSCLHLLGKFTNPFKFVLGHLVLCLIETVSQL